MLVELDAGRAGPARLGPGGGGVVALAGRVVELGLLRADDDVVESALAEVDARLGDRRRARRRDAAAGSR